MRTDRRRFLSSAAALAAASAAALAAASAAPLAADSAASRPIVTDGVVDWDAVRNDFPWAANSLWLSGADYHPVSVHGLHAVETYYRWRVGGPRGGGARYSTADQRETKERFGVLIGASASEIAFTHSTTEGENIVVAGMDLGRRKGNVVLDDLHYQASKFLYHMLQQEADIELRVVRSRKDGFWRTDPADMIAAIDDDTLLVSIALVSNINGFLHDARRTSDAAHAHGAYLYADIIQGAGAIPIDIRALGIDFASCGTYKWLQGDMGFGFLYVKEALQGGVVRRTQYGTRQFSSPNAAQADSQFDLHPGAAMYETSSTLPYVQGLIVLEALRYIERIGIPNIQAHVAALTDRLQAELPGLGYPAITPPGNPTPIVSFLTPDPAATADKLERAFADPAVALKRWEFTHPTDEPYILEGMRIGPSLFNNDHDVDRLLAALA